MSKPRLIIIDGSNYFYRAFYAIRFLSNSKGLPTNAIYGFTRMLLKTISQEQPEYLGIAFDLKALTFRHEQFADYKAHRSPMPDALIQQVPYIKQVVEAFNIPCLEMAGYEADDIIGTIARKAAQEEIETLIVSGDKDTWQLVNNNVRVFDEIRGVCYDSKTVKEKTGIEPEQLADMMALAGDSSDNIPGVPGIGIKTATSLIKEYGSLDNIFANLEKISNKRRRENLERHIKQAQLSRELVTINTEVPIEFDWEKLRYCPLDYRKTTKLFNELEFYKLLEQLTTESLEQPEVKPEIVLSQEQLQYLIALLKSLSRFSLEVYISSKDPLRGKIVGLSITCNPGQNFYIPLGHDYLNAPAQLDKDNVLGQLKPILENTEIKKSVSGAKFAYMVLARCDIKLAGIDFDPQLASYLINSSKHGHGLQEITLEYLNRQLSSYEGLAGKGNNETTFNLIPVSELSQYGADNCEAVYELTEEMTCKLKDEGLDKLLMDVEIPISGILAQMELAGIRLNVKILEELSRLLEGQINSIQQRVHFMAGEQFNLDSPKQLSYILFERLGLPAMKKTKTGYSTNMEVLQELALFHPLVGEILEYRQLKKLKSTYIDNLPSLINPETERLHTSFNQTVTATGRLSSREPNLQNIPIRTELGSKVRQAFIPADGCKFISADYSQIELRLVAHMAEEESLLQAFAAGEDIHQRTAVEVFQLQPNQVTPEMRRRAKAINFGILYGMSAYGLAKEINVGPKEAQSYIDSYFARYPQIESFINNTIVQARQDGYTTTLFGRRRYIPELKAKDRNTRQFGERMAINSPIQGTAADIIKMAMIAVYRQFARHELSSRLLLQVHDDLLLEVPEEELDAVTKIIKKEMEGVAQLKVSLDVQIKTGSNWAELVYLHSGLGPGQEILPPPPGRQ